VCREAKVKVEIKTVKLSQIKLNPDNPRTISTKDMDSLVNSLQEFPEMMSIREIVVDEGMVAMGGNMRTLALRKAGGKTCIAKVVSGLTPEQKREFVIKDNAQFGEWDMDLLSGWDDLPLVEWGVDLPPDWLKPLDDKLPGEGSGEEKENKTTCPKCGFEYAI
jgi:ParB-like chromosome segregation protein Spo0J